MTMQRPLNAPRLIDSVTREDSKVRFQSVADPSRPGYRCGEAPTKYNTSHYDGQAHLCSMELTRVKQMLSYGPCGSVRQAQVELSAVTIR